jgi:hypothetical protein
MIVPAHPSRAAVIAVVVLAAAVITAGAVSASAEQPAAPESSAPSASPAASEAPARPDGTVVELAPIVAGWPDGYTVTGTKSEALYVEHITSTRAGSSFSLTIDVKSQGESALGVQTSRVEVLPGGGIRWTDGCPKTAADCLDDPGLRGFLTQAALLGAEQRGELPAMAVARTLHGHPVVCVSDLALHPGSPPAIDGLDPCFSVSTGAVLGHYSLPSGAFVGPTLAEGFSDTPA